MPTKLQRTWLANRLWLDMLGRMTPAAVGGQNAAGLPPPTLKFVRLAGTQLTMQWEPVAGSAHYEIYRNTVPSSDGATFVAQASNSFIQYPLNTYGELLPNGGFESGDLESWSECRNQGGSLYLPLAGGGFVTLSETEHHGGAYGISIVHDGTNEALYQGALLGPLVKVNPGSSYVFSIWAKSVQVSAYPNGSFWSSQVIWWNEGQTGGAGQGVVSVDDINASWSQLSATLEAPEEIGFGEGPAVWARLVIEFFVNPGEPFEVYLDDLSIVGQNPLASGADDLYAVCAVDANGNVSALSRWLPAQVQASQLGDPAAAGGHSLLDPANAAIQSSNFVSGSAGYKLSPAGIDGKLLSGGSNPSALYVTTTEVAPTDTNENTLFTCTVPANTLDTGNMLRIRIWITGANSGAAANNIDCTVKIKFGGATVITLAVSCNYQNSPDMFVIDAILKGNGATNAQAGYAYVLCSGGGTGYVLTKKIASGTAAIDQTSDQTLLVTGQQSVYNADNRFYFRQATVEVMEAS